MMASFLPVIVSKKNKQTKKNMSFIAVYHKFTYNLKKTHKKTLRHTDTIKASGNGAECSHVGLPVHGYKARLGHGFILFLTWPRHAG